MVRPDRDTFRALARHGQAVPLVHEVLADLDTPLAIFLKVDDGETAFLFESVEGGERWGRFSFIGVGARARFVSRAGQVEIRRGDVFHCRGSILSRLSAESPQRVTLYHQLDDTLHSGHHVYISRHLL